MNLVIMVEGAWCCRYFRRHPPLIGRRCAAIATDVLRYPGDGFVLQKRNVALLNEDIGNGISAVFTELLI